MQGVETEDEMGGITDEPLMVARKKKTKQNMELLSNGCGCTGSIMLILFPFNCSDNLAKYVPATYEKIELIRSKIYYGDPILDVLHLLFV